SEILSPTHSRLFDFPILKNGSTRKLSARDGPAHRHTNTTACRNFICLIVTRRSAGRTRSVGEYDFRIGAAEADLVNAILAVSVLVPHCRAGELGIGGFGFDWSLYRLLTFGNDSCVVLHLDLVYSRLEFGPSDYRRLEKRNLIAAGGARDGKAQCCERE